MPAPPATLNYANSLRVSGAAPPTSARLVKLGEAELLPTTPHGRDRRRAPQRAGRAGRGSRARRWRRRGVSVPGRGARGACSRAWGEEHGVSVSESGARASGRAGVAVILSPPERRCCLQKAGCCSPQSGSGKRGPRGPPNSSSRSSAPRT